MFFTVHIFYSIKISRMFCFKLCDYFYFNSIAKMWLLNLVILKKKTFVN